MHRLKYALLVAAGLLLACGSEDSKPQLPSLNQAFSNLPLPPQAQFVSQSGSVDALQITFRTPADQERVVNYYRAILTKGKWRLVSDLRNRDGSTTFYAEQDGPPLWVRVWRAKGSSDTMVQLTGAVTPRDSGARKS
jgi:hypothetical protein